MQREQITVSGIEDQIEDDGRSSKQRKKTEFKEDISHGKRN
jgi:hypothetical protein